MKKFSTVVLKIVMFLSFAGIIVFSCIAIISNNNITYEAYNYLTNNKSTLGLSDLKTKVDANIRTYHGAKDDPYAYFLGTLILDTFDTLDYYLDYIALDDMLSKGEQNTLIEDFKACVDIKKKCEDVYSDYMFAYTKANEGVEEYASNLVVFYEKDFLREYKNLYNCVANLQLDLYKVCKINIVKVESYDFQKYIVKTGIASYAVETLYSEENISKLSGERTVIKESSVYKNYNSYSLKSAYFNNSGMIANSNLQNYVNNLDTLDIFLWAKNYNEYLTTLNNSLREKAFDAKTFFDANLK